MSQIIRMPNGDLHVHFRLAEVADTVCPNYVPSVQLIAFGTGLSVACQSLYSRSWECAVVVEHWRQAVTSVASSCIQGSIFDI